MATKGVRNFEMEVRSFEKADEQTAAVILDSMSSKRTSCEGGEEHNGPGSPSTHGFLLPSTSQATEITTYRISPQIKTFCSAVTLIIPDLTNGNKARTLPLLTYKKIYELERNLPQHDLALHFPEGQTGKYVKFSNQITELGWNNVLTDLLLCAHLAWRANRAYVFQDYVWERIHFPWKVKTFPWVFKTSTRTPFNALVAGPTAGGPWEQGDNAPRSISSAWFDVVCPPKKRKIIDVASTKDPIRNYKGDGVLNHWIKVLTDIEDGCVEVVRGRIGDDYPRIFDLRVVSKEVILSLWNEFRTSPVSRLLRTPPLVEAAVKANAKIFFPGEIPEDYSLSQRFESVMAIHVRREDYAGSCKGFAHWNSSFFSWSQLPELPDPLIRGPPIEGGAIGQNTPQNKEMYRRRCAPTDEELVARIHEVKQEWHNDNASKGKKLRTLYIMTDGEKHWLEGFRKRMLIEGWDFVASTADLVLNSDQTAVSNVVDMDIGRQAAVFMGNGWSSMTSNIVHRRIMDGQPYSSIRHF
ncbi:hypothetical protein M422DRAFT_241303 [Sphaerobolus stellatus SS14]|nr:hypothetical protein M422DRAFT_241303 [Sphaerobolus stellatus SS14]